MVCNLSWKIGIVILFEIIVSLLIIKKDAIAVVEQSQVSIPQEESQSCFVFDDWLWQQGIAACEFVTLSLILQTPVSPLSEPLWISLIENCIDETTHNKITSMFSTLFTFANIPPFHKSLKKLKWILKVMNLRIWAEKRGLLCDPFFSEVKIKNW